MRVSASAVLMAAGLAAGLGVGGVGRRADVDMITESYSNATPSPAHLGHWRADTGGTVVFLSPNTLAAGTGAGTVTFGIALSDAGLICSTDMPCEQSPAAALAQHPCDVRIPPGAVVHVEFAHTCATAPTGVITAGFDWGR